LSFGIWRRGSPLRRIQQIFIINEEGCFIGPEIRNDIPVVQPNSYRQKTEAPKTSGSNTAVQEVNSTEAVAANTARIPAEYADAQSRRVLEGDLDNMIKLIFPDLGVKFRVHDSGNIITNIINNTTDEIVREFPAEKILDIVHSMTQRIGSITNKRV